MSPHRCPQTGCRHPRLGQQIDGVELAHPVEHLLGGRKIKLGERGPGEAVGLAEFDNADEVELPGRPLEEDLDPVTDVEVVLVSGALVDDDLVAAAGSWVTITMVWPNSRTERRRNDSNSALERESRLPVGSSAKMISG
jgi:hypothetical protein